MAVFISKDLSVASKIAGSDALFKTALMFVYERAWANIKWGKDYAEGMVRQQQNETEQEKPSNGAHNHGKLFRVVLAVRRRYKLWTATAAVWLRSTFSQKSLPYLFPKCRPLFIALSH